MGELQHKLLEALFTLNCDEESIAAGTQGVVHNLYAL